MGGTDESGKPDNVDVIVRSSLSLLEPVMDGTDESGKPDNVDVIVRSSL